MADTVMPAFLECPAEAGSIGRILAFYGELEFVLCRALSKPLGSIEAGVKLLFASRSMGERARVEEARKHLDPLYASLNLATEAAQAFEAMDWCRVTRNKFAHAAWSVNEEPCLFYIDLNETATSPLMTPKLRPVPLDAKALEKIEAYFLYTERCLSFLHKKASGVRNPARSMPPKSPHRSGIVQKAHIRFQT
jgi:hypothetical protein